jgi:NOL1/NOP2/fmu family ribosome biogenesis protein
MEPRAEASGLFFLRTSIRPPKLTTAGAMLLGVSATRNRIELTAEQRDAYLQRREVLPDRSRTGSLRWGQVVACYRGFPLGVGIYHRSGTLESLFPRRWSGCG